ncbi:MAG: adenylate/guanylate cyclase domain-containing protein [Nitrospirota bacterium]
MSRLSKALVLGCLTGISGIILSLFSYVFILEQNIGLDLLFKLRGERQPPPEVVVISIDKVSALNLNLPDNPEKWPRSLHARLIENLVKAGASVIAFDMIFNEARSREEDGLFANAIAAANNVVLCQIIRQESMPFKKPDESFARVNIEKLVAPVPSLEKSSVALAPFPLPRVPINVRQYWTFKRSAGDIPTMPVVVFQIYALDVYEEFIRLLRKTGTSGTDRLPYDKDELIAAGSVEKVVRNIRELFANGPLIAETMLEELQNSETLSVDERKNKLLRSLIRMYRGPDSEYLNFYGFPRTITTIPYYQALQFQDKPVVGQKHPDLAGKAVFVGHSENLRPEFKDGFYTVFTQPDGVDISGVEIVATAFANLLENMNIKSLPLSVHLSIIFFWGLVIGFIWRFFTNTYALTGGIVICVLYLFTALNLFADSSLWYPLVVPLFFQAPLAVISAVSWKYVETNKERQNIKRAFSYYLPDEVVERISKNVTDLGSSSQVVYGTCLSSDAEDYTAQSERMNPRELNIFLNRYYESLFRPVKQYGGIVANVIADEMLAIWVTGQSNAKSNNACLAALGIRDIMCEKSNGSAYLPTRVGVHSGPISLGNIGAGDHYEYRPVGDIVNTATRIEGLNKHLGTRILISDEVLNQLDGFLSRELGSFIPAGKSQHLVLHELICLGNECLQEQKELCGLFADALNAFKQQLWEQAAEMFSDVLKRFGQDGPSLFYQKLCEGYMANPPVESWSGVVRLDKK